MPALCSGKPFIYVVTDKVTRLYVVGGGGCLLKHFSDCKGKTGVEFIDDICANAKGYEMIANQLLKYER